MRVYVCMYVCMYGTPFRRWLRHCLTDRKVADSIHGGVFGIFKWTLSFRSHCGPGVDSNSNRNEYQEYFRGEGGKDSWGVKTAGAWADNLTTFMCRLS